MPIAPAAHLPFLPHANPLAIPEALATSRVLPAGPHPGGSADATAAWRGRCVSEPHAPAGDDVVQRAVRWVFEG